MDSETNELMLLLLRNSAAAMGVKDFDGNYLLVNRQLRRIAGLDDRPAAEIHDHDLFPPRAAAQIAQAERSLAADTLAFTETLELLPDNRPTAFMAIGFPIKDDQGANVAIGLLLVETQAQQNPTAAISEQLARSQQANSELQTVLRDMELRASTDRLTNAWNRRWLEETLLNELSRFERYGHPISILLLDLDHFKQINDSHGHAVGDTVLLEFAERIRGAYRGADSLVRWGGEEFIVLCPNTPLHAAALLAERIRRDVAGADFEGVGPVTCSIGVAEYQTEESWNQWFTRADAAMYRAKANGRNKLELAPESHFSARDRLRQSNNLVELVWRATYECGHEVIDAEHRELFGIANELLAAVLDEQPRPELLRKAALLQTKLATHFQHEEAIIQAARFPEAGEHSQIHSELLTRAENLLQAFARDETNIGELFGFLAYDVVTKHMLRADRLFFEHLAQQTG